ncbi:MAG: hypothetical protein Q9170_004670 [Blastenia crenularia]
MLSSEFIRGNTDNVFAALVPGNITACKAFDEVVRTIIAHPDKYGHASHYIYTENMAGVPSSENTVIEDNDDDEDDEDIPDPSPGGADQAPMWVGGFKLELETPPSDKAGWVVGSGYQQRGAGGELDMIITPPTKEWLDKKVLGRHARLTFHPDSWTLLLEAFHNTTVSGKLPKANFSRGFARVIQHGDTVEFGACSYSVEFRDLAYSATFEDNLRTFMIDHLGHKQNLHKSLTTPSANASKHVVDDYTFSIGSFAAGSYGVVAAGFAGDGSCVAVKSFRHTSKAKIDHHTMITRKLGEHYGFYKPLAEGSVTSLIRIQSFDYPTISVLVRDWLQGLNHMHLENFMMHRDINPNNLGIVKVQPPHGILLDLDSATEETTSYDSCVGTLRYMAPEIIALRTYEKETPEDERDYIASTKPYDSAVDMWSLGLSIWALMSRRPLGRWDEFDLIGAKRTVKGAQKWEKDCVTLQRYKTWHPQVEARLKNETDPLGQHMWALCANLTAWITDERMSAAEALEYLDEGWE